MKLVKLILFNLLITLVLLEFGLFLMARTNLLRMDLPSYSLANLTPFWMDINPDFGVWRPAHSQFRHLKSCFDITYRTNAQGMRDSERPFAANRPRVVVLGDSFVEGFGVERKDRFTNLLQERTGIAHLNFGTSGNFGLTQSWLLYKTFASRFDHDAVVISVLPANDFADDDPARIETRFHDRYRPYLFGKYPNYDLHYSNPNIVKTGLRNYSRYVDVAVNEFSYTARAYSYFKNYFEQLSSAAAEADPDDASEGKSIQSQYFDFTEEQFDRMRYAIERIAALASPRPILVITIPRLSDYLRSEAEAGAPPLPGRLETLSRTANFTYIDLLAHSSGRSDLKQLYHSCDPHWSAKGHAMAAGEIVDWSYYSKGRR